ncbi:hypothetical protein RIF29_17345 [Crotalaria pallida]|uniref:Uncharacterized protein n=1 Tax=Crotalaria pallida TaxID=3830 RepID=A0AAN9FH46_CROPI
MLNSHRPRPSMSVSTGGIPGLPRAEREREREREFCSFIETTTLPATSTSIHASVLSITAFFLFPCYFLPHLLYLSIIHNNIIKPFLYPLPSFSFSFSRTSSFPFLLLLLLLVNILDPLVTPFHFHIPLLSNYLVAITKLPFISVSHLLFLI